MAEVLEDPQVQDGPPPGSIVKPIEASADAGDDGPPPGSVIKPLDGSVVPDDTPKSAPMFPQGELRAHTPSRWQQFKEDVDKAMYNTAPGRAIESAMPRVADALGIHSSESESNPDAQQHAQQLIAPEYLQPEVSALDRMAGVDSTRNQNRVKGVLKGLGGMTSGEAMATLAGTAAGAAATAGLVNPESATILHRLVSGGFTFDMLHSLYQQNKEYRKAVDSGDTAHAQEIQGEMGLTGVMALMTGAHSLHGVAGRPTASEAELTKEAVQHAEEAHPEPLEPLAEGEEPEGAPAGSIIRPIEDSSRGLTAAANADTMAKRTAKAPVEAKKAEAHEGSSDLAGEGEASKPTPSEAKAPDTGGGEKKAKYDYGNTQANIPEGSEASKALAKARDLIDPEDLQPSTYGGNEKGLELDPHVTVRYGIQGDDTKGIADYLSKQAPFEAKLGKISSFPGNKNTGGGAVIKADIEAPELHRMNAEIEKHGDFKKSDFPDYVPHATIAYVKPEAVSKYVGKDITAGHSFKIDKVAISDRNGNLTEVHLKGEPEAAKPQFAKGTRVKLKDGSTGKVEYYNEALGRGRVTTDAGKKLPNVAKADMTPIEVKDEQPATAKADHGGEENAVREQSAAGVLPREQEEGGSGSSERVRRSEQGPEGSSGARVEPEVERSQPRVEGDGKEQKEVSDDLQKEDAETRRTVAGEGSGEKAVPADGKRLGPEAGSVGRVSLEDLSVDPKRFQYKLNTDASGATNKLKDVPWNDALSGIITAWRDPADGKTYVVNGHHRYDLARRHGVKDMAVRVLPDTVKDAPEARIVGAMQNIAEGNGTAVDAAKFMRDTGYTAKELEKYGISLSGHLAEGGTALAQLDQRIFDDVVSGRIAERRGIAIGRAADTPEHQDALLKLIDRAEAKGKTVTNATIEELGRMVKGAGTVSTKTESLFGTQDRTQNLALEKAEVSSYVRNQLATEKKLFGSLTSETKAGKLAEGKNKIDVKTNKSIADKAEQAQEFYDRLSTRKGAVDDILENGAERIAKGENATKVKDDTYKRIRTAIREALTRGPEEAGTDRAEDTAGSEDRGKRSEAEPVPQEDKPTREELEAAGQKPMFKRDESGKESLPSFDDMVDSAPYKSAQLLISSDYKASPQEFLRNEFGKKVTSEADARAEIRKIAEERYAGIREQLTSLPDKVTLYRAVNLKDGNLDTSGLGIYWTDKEDAAIAHWGGKGEPHILKADVDKSNIDMPATVKARMQVATGFQEHEIRVKRGSEPEEVGIRKAGEEQYKPVDKALFKREGSPTWYLKSEKLIDQKMKGPMTGEQLHKMLENGGVKADELKWTGLGDFLKGKFRVTPAEVKAHLADGGIQIQEVTKGNDADRAAREREAKEAFDAYGKELGEKYGLNPEQNLAMYGTMYKMDRAEIDKYEKLQHEWTSLRASEENGNKTKYHSYQLPGGENYREMLLIGPDSADRAPAGSRAAMGLEPGQDFRSGHWDEPNILAHVRMNDRVTPDGKRLLHVEEIQSDWHQKGREHGYKDEIPDPAKVSELEQLRRQWVKMGDELGQSKRSLQPGAQQMQERILQLTKEVGAGEGQRVPSAPFKKDWHEMAFRRVVRMAAENGYDGVSWTPGEKQAERYDLSKQVNEIRYTPKTQHLQVFDKNGVPVSGADKTTTPDKLPDIIGKEATRKLLDSPLEEDEFGRAGSHVLTGDNLRIGGEGMKGFYDKIIPDYARKFGKQWGAKVESGELPIPAKPGVERYEYSGPDATVEQVRKYHLDDDNNAALQQQARAVYRRMVNGESFAEAMGHEGSQSLADDFHGTMIQVPFAPSTEKVPYLPITDEMRKSVTSEGVPLFKDKTAQEAMRGASRVATAARAEVIPADEEYGHAPMLTVNAFARELLNHIDLTLRDGGKWSGVTLPKGYADQVLEGLDGAAKDMHSTGQTRQAEAVEALRDQIEASRDDQGNLVMIHEDDLEHTVGEEQFHSYQTRKGAGLGDVSLQMGQNPEVRKAQRYLEKQGYPDNPTIALLEATAKAANGDWKGAGLNVQEAATMLNDFFDAMVKARGPEVLDDVPRMAEEMQSTLEEARARHGREAKVSDVKAGETAAQKGTGAQRPKSWAEVVAARRGIQEGQVPGGASGESGSYTQQSLFQRRSGRPVEEEEKSETPLPIHDLIYQAGELSTVKTPIAKRIELSVNNSVGHLTKDAGSVYKALAESKGFIAGLWDAYRRPAEWTDFKDILGNFLGKMQAENIRLAKFAEELNRTIPDKNRRIAMTNWVEANGDKGILLDRARKSNKEDVRSGYELATKLTPEEVKIARTGREYFRKMLDAGKDAGLLEQGVANYIMHIHEPDSAAAQKIKALVNFSVLNPDPSIIKERSFPSYFDAEQAGEVPKDKDFGFLVSAYQETFANAIESRAFIRALLENGRAKDGRPLASLGRMGKWAQITPADEPYVLTQPSRPEKLAHDITDYRFLDHPALRNWLWELGEEDADAIDPKLFEDDAKALAIRGDLLLHPEIFKHVENVLGRSRIRANKFGKAALEVSNLLKQSLLSFSGFHQTQETVHGTEHLVNPLKMVKLDPEKKVQMDLLNHGLMVADFDGQQAFSEGVSSTALKYIPVIGDFMARYQHYLFHDYIPRMKMTMALHALDRNRVRFKGKLTDDQILEMTANQSNAAFGGLNYKMMGRSPTFQDGFRLLALAPDFLEARARFVGQALTPYGKEQRVALIRGALVMYAGARILNSILNDGDAKWNKADAFRIVYKGRRYGLRTVQGDILNAIEDPILFMAHRLNPMTTRPFIELVTKRDEFGRQKSLKSQAKDFAKGAVPIPVQGRMKMADTDWTESILNAMGLETGKSYTPAETLARKKRMENIPDKPEDPDAEKAQESHLKYQMTRKLREGKATTTDLWNLVNEGKLSAAEAKRAQEDGEMTELQTNVKAIGLSEALDVYAAAGPAERADIEPIIQQKRANFNQDAKHTDRDREKIEAKLEKLKLD